MKAEGVAMRKIILLALAAALLPVEICAAQVAGAAATEGGPRVENAQRETRAADAGLANAVRTVAQQAEKPTWIGYRVKRVEGEHSICCGNYNDGEVCGTCRLENEHGGVNINRNDSVKLEGSRELVVLLRAENHQVMRVRVASEDCTLDAGGARFVWLTGVKAEESVQMLSGYVLSGNFAVHEPSGLADEAVMAIALHADGAADRALAKFTEADQSEGLRKKTVFWLGEARGAEGLARLRAMAKSDPSAEVRAQITFALSVSREPAALDEMIRMAREDQSGHVRGQALFWLAQKAGKKAVGAISAALEDDPETDVKKKAVFALSQLPKDEGVPKLIEVAQSNRNSEVRKQAMFWLGQSNDPRALEFFEKILTR
ncbi:MAG TPA: HEAT repeat domain-containing protein [Candidatus Dormibacteraeota bacterium]|nr:HEAT repeat domain-containing protein [Candidatus Dormibacteraeota bacterium]